MIIALVILSILALVFVGWMTNQGEGAFVGLIIGCQLWFLGFGIYIENHFITKYW